MHRLSAPLVALALGCARAQPPPDLHNDPQALSYRSRAPVADADARQILAQTVSAARARAPWAESAHIHVADGPIGDGRPKFLFGEARLFLVEYETDPGRFREVEAQDDAAMAFADATALIGLLQGWARRYRMAWDVQLGDRRGAVTADGPDENARHLLEALRSQSGQARTESLGPLRARLDAKYRDRRE